MRQQRVAKLGRLDQLSVAMREVGAAALAVEPRVGVERRRIVADVIAGAHREHHDIRLRLLEQVLRRHRFAADNPGFLLWLVTVLGAALTGGGTVSLGRRLVDAARGHRG